MAYRRNTYLWRHPTNNRLNDISSAADNAIFKNSAQNIECSCGCVARSTVLLQTNVANILLSLLIFEEKWSNYASGPKSPPNSVSFWVRRLFKVCVRVFCAPNATILLLYIPAKIKMSFIWKDDFFFLPKSASSVSRSQANLFKRIHNHISSAKE